MEGTWTRSRPSKHLEALAKLLRFTIFFSHCPGALVDARVSRHLHELLLFTSARRPKEETLWTFVIIVLPWWLPLLKSASSFDKDPPRVVEELHFVQQQP